MRVQMGCLFPIPADFACGSGVRCYLFQGRIGPFVQADAWFGTDRVTCVTNYYLRWRNADEHNR